MNARLLPALLIVVGVLAPAYTRADTSGSAAGLPAPTPTLTVYSAGGMGAWLTDQFAAFTADSGIPVTLVEGGSGEVVDRVDRERANPQADLLITLPPFIQQAAKAGLLQPGDADVSGVTSPLIGPGGIFVPIVGNALSFIASPDADPQPRTWDDLLRPQFRGRLQYSSPGQAGDGTAMLLLLQHLMGRPRALKYLTALEANNTGPSSSTSVLQPKVDSGELWVANGDVQMNLASIADEGSRFSVFFPAMPDGSRTTISIPYVAGVTAGSDTPEAARRLLAFLLSEPVQKSVSSKAHGIPVLDTVARESAAQDGPNTPAGLLSGVEIWVPNWTAVLGEIDYDLAQYADAVGR